MWLYRFLCLGSRLINTAFIILGLFGFNLAIAEPLFIEVVTSDAYPVSGIVPVQRQGVSVRVYNLDDGKRLVSKLGRNLPDNQTTAKYILQQHFNEIGMAKVKGLFIQAFQAVTVSTQYSLTRYPAVVFDHGQSVVYGVTELSRALRLYQQWKARQ